MHWFLWSVQACQGRIKVILTANICCTLVSLSKTESLPGPEILFCRQHILSHGSSSKVQTLPLHHLVLMMLTLYFCPITQGKIAAAASLCRDLYICGFNATAFSSLEAVLLQFRSCTLSIMERNLCFVTVYIYQQTNT